MKIRPARSFRGTFQMPGDKSITHRAFIETTEGRPPVRVRGSRLHGAPVTPSAASAQIKSAILLAALQSEGKTVVHEPMPTRDHTERMIRLFGGQIRRNGSEISIEG